MPQEDFDAWTAQIDLCTDTSQTTKILHSLVQSHEYSDESYRILIDMARSRQQKLEDAKSFLIMDMIGDACFVAGVGSGVTITKLNTVMHTPDIIIEEMEWEEEKFL